MNIDCARVVVVLAVLLMNQQNAFGDSSNADSKNPHFDPAFVEAVKNLRAECDKAHPNFGPNMKCTTTGRVALMESGKYRGSRGYCEQRYLSGSDSALKRKWIEVRNEWKTAEDWGAGNEITGLRYKIHYEAELTCLSDELKKRGQYPDRRDPRGSDWMNMTLEEFDRSTPSTSPGRD